MPSVLGEKSFIEKVKRKYFTLKQHPEIPDRNKLKGWFEKISNHPFFLPVNSDFCYYYCKAIIYSFSHMLVTYHVVVLSNLLVFAVTSINSPALTSPS